MDKISLENFLHNHPLMSISPSKGINTILKGKFDFITPCIEDCFEIKISIPKCFPKEIPKVWETGNRIPRNESFHINPDGTFCLGSPFRLLEKINQHKTLDGFAECLVQYLCGISRKLKGEEGFPGGELEHGRRGVLDDYKDIFKIKNDDDVLAVLRLILMKKRLANKKICPCGCTRRLGRCNIRKKINHFRDITSRQYLKDHISQILSEGNK